MMTSRLMSFIPLKHTETSTGLTNLNLRGINIQNDQNGFLAKP